MTQMDYSSQKQPVPVQRERQVTGMSILERPLSYEVPSLGIPNLDRLSAEEAAAAVRAVEWALSVMAEKRAEQAAYELDRLRSSQQDIQLTRQEDLSPASWWDRALEGLGYFIDWLPELPPFLSR